MKARSLHHPQIYLAMVYCKAPKFLSLSVDVLAVCGEERRLGLDGVTFEIGALRQPHLGASTVETAEA
jgi:hypothetical protein